MTASQNAETRPFVRWAAVEPAEMLPGLDRRTLGCGERLMIAEFRACAGVEVPLHTHPHEQVGYLIEGEAQYVIDGRSYPVRAGQMWRLPGGVPHQVKVGDRPMRVVEVFCPPREDFRAKAD